MKSIHVFEKHCSKPISQWFHLEVEMILVDKEDYCILLPRSKALQQSSSFAFEINPPIFVKIEYFTNYKEKDLIFLEE